MQTPGPCLRRFLAGTQESALVRRPPVEPVAGSPLPTPGQAPVVPKLPSTPAPQPLMDPPCGPPGSPPSSGLRSRCPCPPRRDPRGSQSSLGVRGWGRPLCGRAPAPEWPRLPGSRGPAADGQGRKTQAYRLQARQRGDSRPSCRGLGLRTGVPGRGPQSLQHLARGQAEGFRTRAPWHARVTAAGTKAAHAHPPAGRHSPVLRPTAPEATACGDLTATPCPST